MYMSASTNSSSLTNDIDATRRCLTFIRWDRRMMCSHFLPDISFMFSNLRSRSNVDLLGSLKYNLFHYVFERLFIIYANCYLGSNITITLLSVNRMKVTLNITLTRFNSRKIENCCAIFLFELIRVLFVRASRLDYCQVDAFY